MKKNFMLIILVCFILLLIGCKGARHNHVLINIKANDYYSSEFVIAENSKFIFYSYYYDKQIIRVDKSSKEEVIIKDILTSNFLISEDYLYYIINNKIMKCNLLGNVIEERTFEQNIVDQDCENGYIYLLFEEEDNNKNYKLAYLSEDDFKDDFNIVNTSLNNNIELNGSNLYVGGYNSKLLNVFKQNITYIGDHCSYLYNGVINYEIDKIDYSLLKDPSYPSLYKIINDELYITTFSYDKESNGSSRPFLNCYWQTKETSLVTYNFKNEETRIIYQSQVGELIIHFSKDEVILYKGGKIVGVNLKSSDEKVYGEIEEIEFVKGKPTIEDFNFYISDNYVFYIYNGFSEIIFLF